MLWKMTNDSCKQIKGIWLKQTTSMVFKQSNDYQFISHFIFDLLIGTNYETIICD